MFNGHMPFAKEISVNQQQHTAQGEPGYRLLVTLPGVWEVVKALETVLESGRFFKETQEV